MPFYTKGFKLSGSGLIRNNTSINKNILINHINKTIEEKITNKDPLTDKYIYSYQNPYGGANDAGTFVRNTSCWLNGVSNISCFSPAQRSGANWWQRGGTLITRKHALFAKHYIAGVISGGTPLIFVDENNNSIKRNIIGYGYDGAGSDIAIALLDSEVPNNIQIAKVLPPDYTLYLNLKTGSSPNFPVLSAVSLDQEEKATIKKATVVQSDIINFDNFGNLTDPSAINPYINWKENIITGDSGNPVFFIIDNELVVLTTWWTPTNGSFITSRYSQVNSIIESLSPGEGYSLTPVDLAAVYSKYS